MNRDAARSNSNDGLDSADCVDKNTIAVPARQSKLQDVCVFFSIDSRRSRTTCTKSFEVFFTRTSKTCQTMPKPVAGAWTNKGVGAYDAVRSHQERRCSCNVNRLSTVRYSRAASASIWRIIVHISGLIHRDRRCLSKTTSSHSYTHNQAHPQEMYRPISVDKHRIQLRLIGNRFDNRFSQD